MPYRRFFWIIFGSKMNIGISTCEEHLIESENLVNQCMVYIRIKRAYLKFEQQY